MTEITMKRPSTRLYVVTGAVAIVAGGAVSAFSARQPSTFAMWASAYLVLVAGIAQIYLGLALERLAGNDKPGYAAFWLLTTGNAFVIAGSAAKYAGMEWSMLVTAAGSVLFVTALALLGWAVRRAKWSRLKASTCIILAGLAVCIPIGLILAQQK